MIDEIDRKICRMLQENARRSATELAAEVGLSVSAANERLRRLRDGGVIQAWTAQLAPAPFDASLCAFVLIDMQFEGEADAVSALKDEPEVLELHHISGPHSYLMKLRLADTTALQDFLTRAVKPLTAVTRTETIITLSTAKETLALPIAPQGDTA